MLRLYGANSYGFPLLERGQVMRNVGGILGSSLIATIASRGSRKHWLEIGLGNGISAAPRGVQSVAEAEPVKSLSIPLLNFSVPRGRFAIARSLGPTRSQPCPKFGSDRKMKIYGVFLAAIVLAMLSCMPVAAATTYYVSSAGSDA